MTASTVRTAAQLKMLLRALRKTQALSQLEFGKRVGLSQERISKIETHPERVTVDQLLTLLMALDAEMVIQPRTPSADEAAAPGEPGGW